MSDEPSAIVKRFIGRVAVVTGNTKRLAFDLISEEMNVIIEKMIDNGMAFVA